MLQFKAKKVKNAYYMIDHLAQRKKCDDFWLAGVESFPTIYNMNDFAVIIFGLYYILDNEWIDLTD